VLRWLNEAALARIEPADGRADPAVPPWRGAVDVVGARLAAAAHRTSSVRFVVSDHFARYLVLAWDAGLSSEAERAAYLRHHFESVYGPRAADWRFAFDREATGDSRIAVAIDRPLIEALYESAGRAGLAVAAIEPLAVAAFNRLRSALPAPACFLVMAENGRLTSLLVEGGAPRRVASQRTAAGDARALGGLLAAEMIDAGIARDARMVVCLAEWGALAPAPLVTRTSSLDALMGAPAPLQAAA